MTKMKNILKSKKAAISATLTWIIATFIIIFIMLIYFVLLTFSVLNKQRVSNEDLKYGESKLLITKEFIGFLESDAGNGEKIYDLVLKAGDNDGKDDERVKIFKEKALSFLDTYFNSISYSSSISLKEVGKVEPVGGYGKYIVYNSQEIIGVGEAQIGEKIISRISINIPVPNGRELNLQVDVKGM